MLENSYYVGSSSVFGVGNLGVFRRRLVNTFYVGVIIALVPALFFMYKKGRSYKQNELGAIGCLAFYGIVLVILYFAADVYFNGIPELP